MNETFNVLTFYILLLLWLVLLLNLIKLAAEYPYNVSHLNIAEHSKLLFTLVHALLVVFA
jgi:hypothetical protein